MQIANVDLITMTNPVLRRPGTRDLGAAAEGGGDPRFAAVLRIDPLLRDWPGACAKLSSWGYEARPDFSGKDRGRGEAVPGALARQDAGRLRGHEPAARVPLSRPPGIRPAIGSSVSA